MFKYMEKKEKRYVYNISTIFLQQILSSRLLLIVIIGAKKQGFQTRTIH